MTPTLKLRRLLLSNFGPFAGDHELDLPEAGLVMVHGENKDTDESSGSGKSSLVESLAYVFGYSDFSATDLQTWEWLGKGPMAVTAELEEFGLRRGHKPHLKVPGKPDITGAKSVNESAPSAIGLKPEMLKALTYRPQGKPGLFLDKTDSEKKAFLTELLGLQEYESEVERVMKVISGLEEEERKQTAIVENLKAQVPQPPQKLEPLDTSANDAQLQKLREHIKKGQEALEALRQLDDKAGAAQREREAAVRAKWEPYIENLQVAAMELRSRPLPAVIGEEVSEPAELPVLRKKLALLTDAVAKAKAAHTAKLKQLRIDLQDARTQMQKLFATAQNTAHAATTERARLSTEVASLEQEFCPTCARPWHDDEHKALLEEKRAAIQMCDDALALSVSTKAQGNEQQARAKELELAVTFEEGADPVPEKLARGLQEYTQKVADAEADCKAAKAAAQERYRSARALLEADKRTALAEASKKQTEAESAYIEELHAAQEMTPEHEKVRNTMASMKETIAAAMADHRVITERVAAAKKQYEVLAIQHEREQKVWTEAFERHQKAALELEVVKRQADQERDYLACAKSFLGVIFDETLARIAHLTNERLAKVPNVQSVTLRFVSERETKSTKNVRQEIKAVVEKDGHEVPLKRLSGGMGRAVELAVDLSLADVIAERTGVMPGWLVLDEAFDGLSLKSKVACLELLQETAQSRLVLVIEHTSELRDLFAGIITVQNSAGVASFG